MAEFYAPKARAEAEAVEAAVWELVKQRYADNTVKWADVLEHPQTGKFGVQLPPDWRDLEIDIAEVDIQTHGEMIQSGWFPVSDM
ncbi:MAG: hypothetical protein KAJ19_02860 [Gammaproteobacteria bacterium]|nr:hypothetical protein [Gammaproteobacteria bacterium]